MFSTFRLPLPRTTGHTVKLWTEKNHETMVNCHVVGAFFSSAFPVLSLYNENCRLATDITEIFDDFTIALKILEITVH